MTKIFEKGLNNFTTAVVGKNFTSDTSYMVGYWEAGDILIDTAIKQVNPLKDRLFFPICYNYRHFIELCLKHLILKSEKLYLILEEHNMQNKNLKQKLSDEINNTHNIHTLLYWLINILECISDDKFSKEIMNFILEYHNMDKNGQKFRYPRTKDDVAHFELREEFDLEKIKNAVTKLGNYLLGIDMYLSEHGSFIKTYISEMESLYDWQYDHQEDYYYQ